MWRFWCRFFVKTSVSVLSFLLFREPSSLQSSGSKETLKGEQKDDLSAFLFTMSAPRLSLSSPELQPSITSASTVMADFLCAPSANCSFKTSDLLSELQTPSLFMKHSSTPSCSSRLTVWFCWRPLEAPVFITVTKWKHWWVLLVICPDGGIGGKVTLSVKLKGFILFRAGMWRFNLKERFDKTTVY